MVCLKGTNVGTKREGEIAARIYLVVGFFFPLESRIELLYQLAMCLVHGCGTEQIFFPQLHIDPTALPSAMCGMEVNTDAGSPILCNVACCPVPSQCCFVRLKHG